MYRGSELAQQFYHPMCYSQNLTITQRLHYKQAQMNLVDDLLLMNSSSHFHFLIYHDIELRKLDIYRYWMFACLHTEKYYYFSYDISSHTKNRLYI